MQIRFLQKISKCTCVALQYHTNCMGSHLACLFFLQAVEVTIQNLIGSGMDPKTQNNPYLGFIYTSFQARMLILSKWAHQLKAE